MTSRLPPLACLAAIVIVASACGSTVNPTPIPNQSIAPGSPGASAPAILPIPVTEAFRVGDNRVVFTLADRTGQKQVASPDRTLSIAYHGPTGETIAAAPQTFAWAIEGVNGVYIGHATFASAGKWTADFTTTKAGAPTE
ncbi:MAG: hypothetical protein ABIZ72_03395, partial [Candidatus Limnocylindrales bacterium]